MPTPSLRHMIALPMPSHCKVHVTQVLKTQPGLNMPIKKCGGIWQRLGLDRPKTPPPALLAPLVPCVRTKGAPALWWRQHCSSTLLLSNTASIVKLRAAFQKTADVCALRSEDNAKLGVGGRDEQTFAMFFNTIASNSVGCPEPYMAKHAIGAECWTTTSGSSSYSSCCHMRCCTM